MTSIAIRDIQRVVANEYSIELRDLIGPSRKPEYAVPRQAAMALIKELTDCSLNQIGRAFGGRDHTTVLHGINADKERRAGCLELRERFRAMIQEAEYYQPAAFHRHGSIAPVFKTRRSSPISGVSQ